MDGPANLSQPDEPVASQGDAASASAGPESRPLYPPSASSPTQTGPEGIHFDFNRGCRVLSPPRTEGLWRVRLYDLDTGNTLFQSENAGAIVSSSKRWFVRFRIEVWSLAGKQPSHGPC